LEEKEITLKLRKIVGAQTPFWQGGSFRMILPKWISRKYCHKGMRKSINKNCGLDQIPFVFIETNKGILMMPLKDLISDSDIHHEMKKILATGEDFLGHPLTNKELKELVESLRRKEG
jgi:hypothetical protein